jgi:hypothetical protein
MGLPWTGNILIQRDLIWAVGIRSSDSDVKSRMSIGVLI